MSRHARRRAFAVATLVTAVSLAAPSAASAHVGVSPDQLLEGEHGVLTFSFAHGCDDSPTAALRITMPKGLTSVAPTWDSDWNVDIERGDDGLVSAVTFTAVTPVPVELRGAVSLSVGLEEDAAETLAFPVVQQCVDGRTEWNQIAAQGEDPHSLDAPAPVVSIAEGEDAAQGAHGVPSPPAAAPADPLGPILGGAGLLTAAAALILAVLAYRRRD